MATIVDTEKEAVTPDTLGPVLSAAWVLKPRHLVACIFLGTVILYINTLPLLDSTIWLDVFQGQWIVDHGVLPKSDPAQPLTDGMQIVHTNWLAQVAYGLADRWGGPRAVSNLFAALMLAYLLVLARVFYKQTGRVSLTIAGLAVTLLVGATFDLYASAEVFGQLCFALLVWLLTRLDRQALRSESADASAAKGPGWRVWLAVVALLAIWANLHGSYLLGIAVLALHAIAEGCDTAWQTRSLRATLADETFRSRLLLAEVALFATFLNPYGPMLLVENLSFLGDERLMALPRWLSLNIASPRGLVLVCSIALLAPLIKVSRRPVRVIDVLLLGFCGAAVVITGRAQGWYALAYAVVTMPYVAEVVDRLLPARPASSVIKPLTPRSFVVTLLCGLAMYCAFRLAPASRVFLGGNPRHLGDLIGSNDLMQTADFLRTNPPQGLVYASTEWSDYLVSQSGPETKALMTSNVQWVPHRIWSDHRRMATCEEGWELGMDRYAVDTLVLDKTKHAGLVKSATRSPRWWTAYENESVLVARRVASDRPAGGADTEPAGETENESPHAEVAAPVLKAE